MISRHRVYSQNHYYKEVWKCGTGRGEVFRVRICLNVIK